MITKTETAAAAITAGALAGATASPRAPLSGGAKKSTVLDEFDTSSKYLEDEYGPEEEEELAEADEFKDEDEEETEESELDDEDEGGPPYQTKKVAPLVPEDE